MKNIENINHTQYSSLIISKVILRVTSFRLKKIWRRPTQFRLHRYAYILVDVEIYPVDVDLSQRKMDKTIYENCIKG
jgi:hypothetical protein